MEKQGQFRYRAGLKKCQYLWFLLSLFSVLIAQAYFCLDDPVIGVIIYGVMSVAVLKTPEEWWEFPVPKRFSKRDLVVVLLIWMIAICIRIFRVGELHNIGDLSSRFGFGVIQILKGNQVFPFFTQYEFDESLVSYLFAPFIFLFGRSWTNFKVISIVLSSFLVPVSYLYVREFSNRSHALSAAGLIALSGYFQICDPLIDMVRYNLIGLCMLFILWIIQRYPASTRKIFLSITMGVIGSIAIYLHSQGRIIPVLAITAMLFLIGDKRLVDSRKVWSGIAIVIFTTLVGAIPLVISIIANTGYVFFKSRQIYGLHELYPFTLRGIFENIFSTITNFNYRAVLQSHFSDKYPLLHFETACGILGGVWLVWKNRRECPFKMMLVSMIVAIAPLCLITPGKWRGLYYTPAVTILTVIAGIWLAFITQKLLVFSKKFSFVFLGILFLWVAWIRIPTFYEGAFSPPKALSQITLLYEDLKNEPDVPHFFSKKLDQCNPGNSIFEFTKGAYFNEYYVFALDPLRYFMKHKVEAIIDQDTLRKKSAVFVLSTEDQGMMGEFENIFPSAQHNILPLSRLMTIRVNWSEQGESLPVE